MPSSKKKKKKNRDDWCTPPEMWKLALKAAGRRAFDVDPFSNEMSTVPAKKTYIRTGGEDHVMKKGEAGWANGPFSKPGFWFQWSFDQMDRGASVYGLARFDPSTEAWKRFGPNMVWIPPYRVEYIPPPGVSDDSGPNFMSALCLWSSQRKNMDRWHRAFENSGGYLGLRNGPFYE